MKKALAVLIYFSILVAMPIVLFWKGYELPLWKSCLIWFGAFGLLIGLYALMYFADKLMDKS